MDGDSIEIRLYQLERSDTVYPDEPIACIVAARNEESAREIANSASGAEGYVWTDGTNVSCQELGVATGEVQGVLMWGKPAE